MPGAIDIEAEAVPAEALGTPPTPEASGPPALRRTVRRWLLYDAANSVYSTVGIGGFIPLLLVTAALRAAGFPGGCANVSYNTTAISDRFPWSDATAMHFMADPPPESCPTPGEPRCVGGWCIGEPATAAQCLAPDGITQQTLRVDGMDPNAFTTFMISASVAVQAVLFICAGGAADHPRRRQLAMWGTTALGSLCTIAFLAVTPSTYWLGGVLLILSNAAFGYSTVAYNAYLPGLVSAMPAVRTAPAHLRAAMEEKTSSSLSNRGFAAGFTAGVGAIVLTLPIVLTVADEILAYGLAVAVAGVWWASVGWWSMRGFAARDVAAINAVEGAAASRGHPVLKPPAFGLASVRRTWAMVRQLPQTARLLGLFFFYSDGVFVISSIGSLFAASEVRWGCIPKALGIALIFLLVPLCGAGANHATRACAHRYAIPAKRMVIGSLAVVCLLAIYGLLGFVSDVMGVHTGEELVVVASVFGAAMATMQGFSRAMLVRMTPAGHEASVMALYEVSDKGSSWLGPLVIAAVQQSTGQLRWGFLYIVFMTAIPAAIMGLTLDEHAGARAAREYTARHGLPSASVSTESALPCPPVDSGDLSPGLELVATQGSSSQRPLVHTGAGKDPIGDGAEKLG